MNTLFIKLVPPELIGGKTLYVSTGGDFFNAKGNRLKPNLNPSIWRYKKGSHYPCMRNFGNRACHLLVWETFVGPRHKDMEIDHINGNKLDWSLNNLQEVTPQENRRRSRYLRVLREHIPAHWQVFNREDYLGFYSMPFDEFKAMMEPIHYEPGYGDKLIEYELSHHCEM